jgi:hypothetical protein
MNSTSTVHLTRAEIDCLLRNLRDEPADLARRLEKKLKLADRQIRSEKAA